MQDSTAKTNWCIVARIQNSTLLYITDRRKPAAFVVGQTLRRSIGFAASALQHAKDLSAQLVEVNDTTNDDFYTVAFESFRHYQFSLDCGFGLQFAGELGRWQRNGEPAELEKREQRQAAKSSQLTMFDTSTDNASNKEVYR